jgi:isopentenyl-diphosphate Delta-isomerase
MALMARRRSGSAQRWQGRRVRCLPAAVKGTEAVIAHVEAWAQALRIACFATGSKDLAALRTAPLL